MKVYVVDKVIKIQKRQAFPSTQSVYECFHIMFNIYSFGLPKVIYKTVLIFSHTNIPMSDHKKYIFGEITPFCRNLYRHTYQGVYEMNHITTILKCVPKKDLKSEIDRHEVHT